MPKTKEELQQLKIEYESLNNKLKDLSDKELKEIIGGIDTIIIPIPKKPKDNLLFNNITDDLNLLNSKAAGNVDFHNVEVKGSISNHEDPDDIKTITPFPTKK